MKNVHFETIGTRAVLTAVAAPTIDPEATKAAVAPSLAASAEWERIKSVRLKIAAARKEARDKAILARDAYETGNEAKVTQYTAESEAAAARIPALEEELKPLIADYEKKRETLFLENPAYFSPGPGAVQVSDDEAADFETKLAALKEHEMLTLEGEILPDYRGVEYWKKQGSAWVKTKIEEAGVPLPQGSVLPDNLTEAQHTEIDAQKEAARIAAMTPEQKAAEIQTALDALADEAARLEKRAQIQGGEFDAASWYAERKAPVEAKYA
jgi:hypothetical protein